MNKINPIVVGIIIIAAGWLILSGNQSAPQDADSISAPIEFRKAPNFNLKDFSGRTVALTDFSGTPLVINSWAAWCPFCVKELKDFATVQRELGNRVVFIAIDRAESLTTAKNFTDENGVTETLVFLLDPRDFFYQSIGGFSMPETIFVDEGGNIVDHKHGPMDLGEIRERVQKILSYGQELNK